MGDQGTAQPMPQDPTIFGALRATESKHRRVISLDGIWSFVPDRAASGQILEGRMTVEGASPVPIAVPASWNEQLPELDTFLGPAWYRQRVATTLAEVWLRKLCRSRLCQWRVRWHA